MGYSLIDQLLLLIYVPHVELNDIDIVFLTSIKTKCVTHFNYVILLFRQN